ncbi:MAG: 2-oxoisovalerate dehydrogenase [Dehalococcoidia bacterium]|nr:2-oxoisovalerate dehydrogenase [Dehalococcoidia bacterium]
MPLVPTEVVFVAEEAPEGGWLARAVGEGIFTEADTLDELRAMVRDAVSVHFDDDAAPQIIRLHFVREELLGA